MQVQAAWAMPAGSHTAADLGLPFDTIVLCTPDGPKAVSVEELYGDPESAPADTAQHLCPWCLGFALIGHSERAAPPTQSAASVPADWRLAVWRLPQPSLHSLGFQCRAPPV